jgi:DNA-binding beta-propeller fold protein YncE
VAHPSNDAVDVIDLSAEKFLYSITGHKGVAGVWVSAKRRLLFTSNRGEDTASVFLLDGKKAMEKFRVPTGVRPNGMAFDEGRNTLMVAGVGNAEKSNASPYLTFIDTSSGKVIGKIWLPGRTRWALYNADTDSFFVNVADPPSIVSVRADDLSKVSRTFNIPARGPHGLEQNKKSGTLYCACDEGILIGLNLGTGATEVLGFLTGPPDVIWLNQNLDRLYIAVGGPGVIDVFDTKNLRFVEKMETSPDAHTLTVDHRRGNVHVFLPDVCLDLILADRA